MDFFRGKDNLHSRVVTFLKVFLPLGALALLSTLFLFSRGVNPHDALPYAEVDVQDRLREPRMTDAGFSGMTQDGSALRFSASDAIPGQNGAAKARGVMGSIETKGGITNEVAAVSVGIDPIGRQILLSEGVELKSSGGMILEMQGLDISMDKTLAQSRGDISVAGPFGQLTAQEFRLSPAQDASNDVMMVFRGNVRLLYLPAK
jgi:lipopolysaccharide export system protein LptC